MSFTSPSAAARRSSNPSGDSRRSCFVAHRHKRSPVSSACRIPVITQNGEAAKITYLHNASGQRVFKSEPQTAQTLPNETVLGTTFVDWLRRNFQWLYATAQTNATLGTSYSYGEASIPSWAMTGEYGNGGATSTGRTEYIWLPTDDGNAIPVGMFRGNRFYAIHSDHLGTPRLVTDDTAKPVWQWAYSAFGDNKPTGILKATTNPNTAVTNSPVLLNATNPAMVFNLRFPGQYADSETGLFYNYFRTYDPKIRGGYIQPDPIGLDGGWNRFDYSYSNPLSYTDPMGLNPLVWTAAACAAAPVACAAAGAAICWSIPSCREALTKPVEDFVNWCMESRGRGGERGATGGSSGQGTDNPYKHCRNHPTNPKLIECRHHQTGKWIPKPKPADWPGG